MNDQTKEIIAKALGSDVATLDAEPYGTVDVSEYGGKPEISPTVSVYHWLNERAEYSPEMQAKFDAFAEERDSTWISDMEAFAKIHHDDTSGEAWHSVNTYNHDSVLSDILQFVRFETADGDNYAAIQIHGGGDVRGGYGRPILFEVGSIYDEYSIHNDTVYETAIYAENDAFNSNQVDALEAEHGPGQKSETVWCGSDDFAESNPVDWRNPARLTEFPATDNPDLRGKGHVYIDDDYNGYCPLTGGKLEVDRIY